MKVSLVRSPAGRTLMAQCCKELFTDRSLDKLVPALAGDHLRRQGSGHTLQATALVHEAYIRLVDVEQSQHWNGRGHFFAAAAESMRRILVEDARRKQTLKQGAGHDRLELSESNIAAPQNPVELLAVDEALDKPADIDKQAAELVKLRYHVGLTMDEIAQVLEVSLRKAHYLWAFARSWLRREIHRND